MKKHFLLNFLNGFLTTLLTFVIIQLLPLPNLPFNIDKVLIYGCITFIIALILLRNRPIINLIAAIVGGVLAGFLIFNYSIYITDFFVNTVLGGLIVGVIGTGLKYLISIIMSFI